MKTKRAGLYMRVSTTDQHPGMQERELRLYIARRGWVVYDVYSDKGVSGCVERRPGLDRLLQDCRRGKIDFVVVWKFDRFGRSLKQLVNALEMFRQLGIGFVSCTEAIDTSLPSGELLFQLIASIAQFERGLIAERVRAGIQHARSSGKPWGRPPLRRLTRTEIGALRSARAKNNVPFRTLAKDFGISVFAAHRLCNKGNH